MFIKEVKSNNNFLFIGEAGCGKSEIALNFAMVLHKSGEKPVHFFDMDMTKPLFRSRDLCEELEASGIQFHHEEQFMDAPTLVGGVSRLLRDQDCYVVMDVGGDYIGARAIGGFAPIINREGTVVYYILNPYRPWSFDIDHIDKVLAEILGVSHIQLEKLHLVSNPNIGKDTEIQEITTGHQKLDEMVRPYKPLEFLCVKEDFYQELQDSADSIQIPIMPLHLYLKYPWITD